MNNPVFLQLAEEFNLRPRTIKEHARHAGLGRRTSAGMKTFRPCEIEALRAFIRAKQQRFRLPPRVRGKIRTAIPLLRQLFELQDALGWTNAALSRKANVNAQGISTYRLGHHAPSLDTFLDLAEALDCDVRLMPRVAPQPNLQYNGGEPHMETENA